MKVLILMGSPRLHGNTAELCKYFMEELKEQGVEVNYIELEKMTVNPCRECYVCQDVAGEYGCVQTDDMEQIVKGILWADLIVLATPIFSWYCTAKMKAVLDRHYGFNKYYGSAEGNLWKGKKVGIIATHGYEGDYATEPFEIGIKRLCIHSELKYIGMYSVQDNDNIASFRTHDAKEGAKAFARKIVNEQESEIIENMINWAQGKLGNTQYAGWCLAFIEDALEISNDIEIFGGDCAKESCERYYDAIKTGIPERGAFVFYDCLCPSEEGLVNWGHCGISLGEGQVIHAWDTVRIDDFRQIEKLTSGIGEHPKYIGWVPLERVLLQKPDK